MTKKLANWEKEDIKDLLEEWPSLLDMNDSELETVSRGLYLEASHLFEEVNRLENNAETIKKFIQLRKEYNYEMSIEEC